MALTNNPARHVLRDARDCTAVMCGVQQKSLTIIESEINSQYVGTKTEASAVDEDFSRMP
jgi:hypothetical protein